MHLDSSTYLHLYAKKKGQARAMKKWILYENVRNAIVVVQQMVEI